MYERQLRLEARPERERQEDRQRGAWSEANEEEEMEGVRAAVTEANHEAEEQAMA